eukprot:11171453-Lingulodinium_polyedra.AAC.1
MALAPLSLTAAEKQSSSDQTAVEWPSTGSQIATNTALRMQTQATTTYAELVVAFCLLPCCG